jgi:hypothetical protein
MTLPKRDIVLLPTICLLTIGAIVAAAQALSRGLYAESPTTTFPCLVTNDPTTGVRAIPNTRCSEKFREGALIEYAFNRCGHRDVTECGPKPADAYRIVLIGSSFNFGMSVPVEKSFAALLPGELSRRTGHKIELYNEAMQWGFPHSVDLRFKEVLAAKPDLILWPLTPMDLESGEEMLPSVDKPADADQAAGSGGDSSEAPRTLWGRLKRAARSKSPSAFAADAWKRVASNLKDSRPIFLLQHLLFESQSMYVKQYLLQSEATVYLRTDPGAEWRQKLATFAGYFADIQARAKAIGATVVVVMMPERAQAALLSMGDWPDGVDPYALGRDVRAIVTREGGTYLDILGEFRRLPNPEKMYLPVDGHPDEGGHVVISNILADALSGGAVPALHGSSGRVTETESP